MVNFQKLLLIVFFSSATICNTQAQTKAVLTEATVDKFIETIKPMNKELKELGHDLSNGDDFTMTVEVKAILSKYGWNESFGLKFAAITLGFSYLKMMENADKMSQEQREMMEKMYTEQYKILVHEDDLKLIKPKLKEIEAAFIE